MALFAYNGDYQILGPCIKTGAHDGDWEHLTVRCDRETGDVMKVYYASHRYIDGEWVEGLKIPRNPDTNRIQVFVAHNGHGFYPRAGTQFRLFGLANDKTSKTGMVWRPESCVLVASHSIEPMARIMADDATSNDRALNEDSNAADGTNPKSIDVAWFGFDGYWGKSRSPHRQAWLTIGENIMSRTKIKRMFLPCVK